MAVSHEPAGVHAGRRDARVRTTERQHGRVRVSVSRTHGPHAGTGYTRRTNNYNYKVYQGTRAPAPRRVGLVRGPRTAWMDAWTTPMGRFLT